MQGKREEVRRRNQREDKWVLRKLEREQPVLLPLQATGLAFKTPPFLIVLLPTTLEIEEHNIATYIYIDENKLNTTNFG